MSKHPTCVRTTMRYYGGNVNTTFKAPERDAYLVSDLKGTITITTRRGAEFMLYRVPGEPLPKFFRTHSGMPTEPVMHDSDGSDFTPYAVFTVEGDVVGEERLLTLTSEGGHRETLLILKLVSEPDRIPIWARDGKCGHGRKWRSHRSLSLCRP